VVRIPEEADVIVSRCGATGRAERTVLAGWEILNFAPDRRSVSTS
jgi:hypothetical protein